MSEYPQLALIVAASRNGVIGVGDRLPWRLPLDMKFFRTTTMGHHVIMGRKTWESLPKPLAGRTNVVVTRQKDLAVAGGAVVHGLGEAIELAARSGDDEAFVIGGGQLYAEALPLATRVYLTRVDAELEGDVFFRWHGGEGWRATSVQRHGPDERHAHPFEIWRYDRVRGAAPAAPSSPGDRA